MCNVYPKIPKEVYIDAYYYSFNQGSKCKNFLAVSLH